MSMNELLAQIYNTEDNISADYGHDKTAEALVLDELEKVAAAQGVDLNEFTDDELAEIVSEAIYEAEGHDKQASAEGEVSEEDMEKLAQFDFLGRAAAHAFVDEVSQINGHNKFASAEDFEDAAVERANAILEAVGAFEDDSQEKQASADEEGLDDALNSRAAELLDAAGWDVDQIAEALSA